MNPSYKKIEKFIFLDIIDRQKQTKLARRKCAKDRTFILRGRTSPLCGLRGYQALTDLLAMPPVSGKKEIKLI